jgi:hypothetical protein
MHTCVHVGPVSALPAPRKQLLHLSYPLPPLPRYTGDLPAPLSPDQVALVARLGALVEFHSGPAPGEHPSDALVLSYGEEGAVDGVVAPNVLYIQNPGVIDEVRLVA